MKSRYTLISVAIVISVGLLPCYGQGKILSDSEIDIKLLQLKPLPKVHYYWPMSAELSNRRLYELARITHSVCVSGDWVKQDHVDKCVYVCARVNKTNPSIKVSLGVNFSPWHRRFDKDLPPTDRGPTYWKEIRFFEERARLVKRWVEQSNKKYKSSVRIGAITLDSERFHTKPGDKVWNEAIREALDAIHIRAQSVFPGARIEWFVRGVGPSASAEGWSNSRYWTGKEIKAPMSCALYRVPEIECTRETFRRTCRLADQLGIEDVTPWVALASGWRRHPTKYYYWSTDWDYDVIYSHLIGAELNNKWYGDRPKRYAPYNRAKVIIFYPHPFDKRTPSWTKHFIAYVRGATGVSDLADLGFKE